MMLKSSQDLWIEPTAPLGDAAEDAGAFGGVCGPLGVEGKKGQMADTAHHERLRICKYIYQKSTLKKDKTISKPQR